MTHEPFDLVIYHANCLDGFAAAWAARKHSPNAEFIPATYGDEPPPTYDKRVLVVDFSYPRNILLAMASGAADLLVLDHHKTAAEDLACAECKGSGAGAWADEACLACGGTGSLDFAVFDMERSGCGITWDTLCTPIYVDGHPRPWVIDYVEDRDLWCFALPNTKTIIAALSALPFDFGAWDRFQRLTITDALAKGQAVLGFTRKTCESIASRAYDARLPYNDFKKWASYEHRALAVNCPPEFVSDTADILKPRAAGRAIVGWFFDGANFVFSLRSADDGPDVSEIARAFGGGGHKHAAGFRWGHNLLVKS